MKKVATVNQNICVACGTCIIICPREAISIYKGCYAVVDFNRCIGCGICNKLCPTESITVVERRDRNEEK